MKELDPDWLTIKEVAGRLQVGPKQVRKWIKAGQFREIAVFSKRLIRISRVSYEAFLAKYVRAA